MSLFLVPLKKEFPSLAALAIIFLFFLNWLFFLIFFWCTPFGYLYFIFPCVIASFAYSIQYMAPGFQPTTTQLWVLCLNH
jgi:hypothetical protein